MKYLQNIIITMCSLPLIMVGLDKFLAFMEPPCSLMVDIPSVAWKITGVVQIVGGILIWFPKLRKYVVGFFFVFMLTVTSIHLIQDTSDLGGSIFMAVLFGLLIWNPNFIRSN